MGLKQEISNTNDIRVEKEGYENVQVQFRMFFREEERRERLKKLWGWSDDTPLGEE